MLPMLCHKSFWNALTSATGNCFLPCVVVSILLYCSNELHAAVVVNSLSYTLDAKGQQFELPYTSPVEHQHVTGTRSELSDFSMTVKAVGTDPGGESSYYSRGRGEATFKIQNLGDATFGQFIVENAYSAGRDYAANVAASAYGEITFNFTVVGGPVHFMYGYLVDYLDYQWLANNNTFSLTRGGSPVDLTLFPPIIPVPNFPNFPLSSIRYVDGGRTYIYEAVLQPGEYTLFSHTAGDDLPRQRWVQASRGISIFGFTPAVGVPELSSFSLVGIIGCGLAGVAVRRRIKRQPA